MNPPISRRIKLFRFTPELLVSFFTEKAEYHVSVESGMPADAKVVGKGFDPALNVFWLHIESATFEPVADHTLLPIAAAPILKNNLLVRKLKT